MTAPVRIEAEAWDDLRFKTLARLLGMADGDHALIKCGRLWSWQAERYTPDAPTYVVDADTIDSALEVTGAAAAMVRAKLADEVPEGYRIRGAEGRIEWLWQRRQAAKAGGEATKRKHNHKEEPGGLPGGPPTAQPPAEPKPSPLVLALIPEDRTPASRAIPPTPGQTPPQSAWQRRRGWWLAMLEADARIKASGIEPNASALPNQAAGENEKNLVACERQLLDAGYDAPTVDAKMRHIVLVAEAEAMREGHRRWFKPALIWNPERANRAADTTLEEARLPRVKTAATGSQPAIAPPRKVDPVRPVTLDPSKGPLMRPGDSATQLLAQALKPDARAGPASSPPTTSTDDKPPEKAAT